jgi:hypothetical protein
VRRELAEALVPAVAIVVTLAGRLEAGLTERHRRPCAHAGETYGDESPVTNVALAILLYQAEHQSLWLYYFVKLAMFYVNPHRARVADIGLSSIGQL